MPRSLARSASEPCINSRILGLGSYFKEPNEALARQLVDEQLEDGDWNCEAPKSRRSSFHTIYVLEGLLDYEMASGKSAAVTKARTRAENYLLERRMFRSLRTGEVIDKRWLRFTKEPASLPSRPLPILCDVVSDCADGARRRPPASFRKAPG